MKRSRDGLAWLTLLLITVGQLSACGPEYASLRFENISKTPVPVLLEPEQITIPVGIAVNATVTPLSRNTYEYDEYYELRLRSHDAAIAEVLKGPGARDFVFLGVAAGSTCVELLLNDASHECINITISPPKS